MRPKSEENIQARGRAVRAWLPGVVLAIGLAPSALAGAYTYTYAGNPLTLCSGPGCVTSPPYPVITGSFTLASPLGANLPYGPITPLSYEISDGTAVLTNTNSTLPDLEIATKSGVITSWYFFARVSTSTEFLELYTSFQAAFGYSPEDASYEVVEGVTIINNANEDEAGRWSTFTTLYSFCAQSNCTDGQFPKAGLIQATNGGLYGTAQLGGSNGGGMVFSFSPSGGTPKNLYNFCSQTNCTDGANPYAGLVQATNGDLYGTTEGGGASGYGTVFNISPNGGTPTWMYSFCSQSNCTDGASPEAALVQATNGDLYGTTRAGGANGDYGTVFSISPGGGTPTWIYSFCSQSDCTDGEYPYAGLIQATNGDLYGTTYGGGSHAGAGTVFSISPGGGTPTTLYSFCDQSACGDSEYPYAGLVQATDGNFYGTTGYGGLNSCFASPGCGTIFKITPSGTLTTLYSFCSQSGCADGSHPYAGLVQDTNGDFYGTTTDGGANGNGGTIFSLSVGLGPFVKTLPTSGKVGTAVKILGTKLTGATHVRFNGTNAVFKVVSSSEITTTVPKDATTGTVEVVTPGGTLSSNVPFQVP